jgi:hypothetical protein
MRGDEHKPGSPSLRRPRRRRPPGAAQRPAASPSPGTQPKLGPGATTKSDRAGGRGYLEKGGASAHSRLTPRGGGGVEEAERRRRASKAQASTRPADGGRDLQAGGGGDPRCLEPSALMDVLCLAPPKIHYGCVYFLEKQSRVQTKDSPLYQICDIRMEY